jgi:hypothetical protein
MRYYLLTILLLLFNCASAHILSVAESETSSSDKKLLSDERDKIALIGFYPSYMKKDSMATIPKESLKEEFSIGKDIEMIPTKGNANINSDKIQEFMIIYRKLIGDILISDLQKTITGDIKNPETIQWKDRDVEHYILGILGPEDLSNQGKIDFTTKRTWLTIVSSVISTMTFGTFPALTYRDTETYIYLFDKDLYKTGELKSKSQVFTFSAWWVHFLAERKDRKISNYYDDKIPYKIYYAPEVEKLEQLTASIIRKKKK